jgi:hypothetical protein
MESEHAGHVDARAHATAAFWHACLQLKESAAVMTHESPTGLQVSPVSPPAAPESVGVVDLDLSLTHAPVADGHTPPERYAATPPRVPACNSRQQATHHAHSNVTKAHGSTTWQHKNRVILQQPMRHPQVTYVGPFVTASVAPCVALV